MRRWIIKAVDAIDMQGGYPASLIVCVLLFGLAGIIDQSGGSFAKFLAPGSFIYRFNAGFFLAAYGMGGRSVVRFVWLRFRDGRRFFEPTKNCVDRLMQVLMAIGFVYLVVFGVLTWFVGWNGARTGTAFGVGVFAGITMYGWSIGRYLDKNVLNCSDDSGLVPMQDFPASVATPADTAK
ncbi:hypothetical protein R8871_05512 [Paraburkholderia graminis C4D1M]|uniref:Transmembrane protein n=1 Tax=Paraburkholderia graminis (strain ATCC 700544 / DSM 17151 / LMG 18924 / NCIMB 13744 / C4D1M) TaxID=396598 RepID=B1FWM5_PARG4|nr:hypothetical protein [Paraburkholderia graminis]EDT12035.1 hypothetical protein BgramDRAFT_1641 [Paraburkholderia graminis C4D1M]CAB3728608.1 hypothetical protein R8871_05512 [Paraburkholderia graminis C4D1M]